MTHGISTTTTPMEAGLHLVMRIVGGINERIPALAGQLPGAVANHLLEAAQQMPNAPLPLWNGRQLVVKVGTGLVIAGGMIWAMKTIYSKLNEGQETIHTIETDCPLDIRGYRFFCKNSKCTEIKCSPWNLLWNGCHPTKKCN